ncbi:MAG: hypothetical protein H0V19_09905, partial [Euzebyales bacterium]|nr:hypothetical protein [Euzebyales bacterium]
SEAAATESQPTETQPTAADPTEAEPPEQEAPQLPGGLDLPGLVAFLQDNPGAFGGKQQDLRDGLAELLGETDPLDQAEDAARLQADISQWVSDGKLDRAVGDLAVQLLDPLATAAPPPEDDETEATEATEATEEAEETEEAGETGGGGEGKGGKGDDAKTGGNERKPPGRGGKPDKPTKDD